MQANTSHCKHANYNLLVSPSQITTWLCTNTQARRIKNRHLLPQQHKMMHFKRNLSSFIRIIPLAFAIAKLLCEERQTKYSTMSMLLDRESIDLVLVPLGLAIMFGYHLFLLYRILRFPHTTVVGYESHNLRAWVERMLKVRMIPNL